MKTYRLFTVMIFLGAMLLLGGCGGGSDASTPAASTQASAPSTGSGQAQDCSLITKSEMETALGQPVVEPSLKPAAGGGTDCSYKTVAQNSTGLPKLTVHLLYYPGVNPGQDPTRQQTVSGIGDDAYYSGSGMNIIKGGNWLVISYLSVTNPGPDPQLEDLARKAAARM